MQQGIHNTMDVQRVEMELRNRALKYHYLVVDDRLRNRQPGWLSNLTAISVLPEDERRTALLARLSRTGKMPNEVKTVDDLEKVLWWGLAMIPTGVPIWTVLLSERSRP